MSAIRIQGFIGTAPRQSPRLLPDAAAQVCLDALLFNKEIRAYRGMQLVQALYNGLAALTFYRYVDAGVAYWFDWASRVNVARVPVTGDTKNRIFYSGDGVPKKTGNDIGIPVVTKGPAAFYYMGVRNPPTAPTAAKSAGPGTGTSRAVTYVITYVTGWGEESGPSPAVTYTANDGDTWTVTRAADTPDALYNITKWRVYRTVTSAQGQTSYYFVGEQATFATTTLSDSLTDAALVLNGGFPSANQLDFAEPPSDLAGLTAMPNGMLAGFSASLKQVCFSEPYFPYAWPTKYRRGLVYDPVSAAASKNMLVVATNGKPAKFIGNDPASLQGDTLDAQQNCLSAQGAAETPFGVVWPSQDGLYLVDPGGEGSIVTRALYDKATWQAAQPAGMQVAVYDGRFYGTILGNGQVLVLDPNEPDDALAFLSISPQALFSDFNADGLYFAISGSIYKWNADGLTYRQYDWRSKVFTMPRPVNMAYARILFTIPSIAGQSLSSFADYAAAVAKVTALNVAEQYDGYAGPAFGATAFGELAFGADDFTDPPPDIGSSITLNVYGDGALTDSVAITDQKPVRLSGGFNALEWEFEVLGKVNIQEIAAAGSMDELQKEGSGRQTINWAY